MTLSRSATANESGSSRSIRCLPGGLYESIDVLLADKPTRGVDIGAKRAIYDVLQSVGRRGAGVLFISSEIEEIIRVARRVLVMRHGRVVSTVNGDDINEETIMRSAFGDHGKRDVAVEHL